MTRARRQLVISSVQPHQQAQMSWWQRLEPLCVPLEVPSDAAAGVLDGLAAPPAVAPPFLMPIVPSVPVQRAQPAIEMIVNKEPTPQSLFGEAVHRLLEVSRQGATAWTAGQLQRIAREFALAPGTLREATAMAQRILEGEGAWAWDPAVVDWQGNEVALAHEGELLRLDRLVRRRDGAEWWVLDYKSPAQPERDPALLEQMRRYRAAVAAACPGAVVKTAFLTGQGRMVEVA
ncbi:MAG: hypothetical protein EOO25_21280 [Comamonadaceae bacterium]|nr:MAG: hypothetical protein EOO25_21280 [Comamonadaceae bacterium]